MGTATTTAAAALPRANAAVVIKVRLSLLLSFPWLQRTVGNVSIRDGGANDSEHLNSARAKDALSAAVV